ncbi:VOC family protein [Paenibacillus sp. HJGM_3]|uniref:VOC family protein n=1 Tax=Paenibacillus sp. HJGM_3 TaxID=3379816 RepID=UPI003858C21C
MKAYAGPEYVDCVYLPAADVEATCEWYAKHFNLPATRGDVLLPGNRAMFLLNPTEPGRTSNFHTTGSLNEMFALCFETNQIEELYEKLVRSGVPVESMQDEGDGGLQFVFVDPNGNKFQVRQSPASDTQPMQENVPALLRISGISVPVTDSEASTDWYIRHLHMKRSAAGKPMTNDGVLLSMEVMRDSGTTSNFATTGWTEGGAYMPLMNFKITGLRMLFEELRADGVRTTEINDFGFGWAFKIYDPDGNMIEVWEPKP